MIYSTNKTKCPYCSTNYEHSAYGPIVNVFIIKDMYWNANLVVKMHDARQPIKCDGCGADFILNVVIENYKQKLSRTMRGKKIIK